MYANMFKLKKLPKTKEQLKFLGPHLVKRITENHVIISQDNTGKKKEKTSHFS